VQKTLAAVDQISMDVRAITGKLPTVMNAAQEAATSIKATADSLKGLTKEVPPLLRSAHTAMDDVNTIIRGAKKTFPVSTMIKNAEVQETGKPSAAQSLRGDQISR